LPKIGKVRFRKSREIEGNIKTATIIKKTDGWYISLSCEVVVNALSKNNMSIGIDVGISTLATLSNGEKIENPHHNKKYEYKLRRLQRAVSRKKKGSANRKKAIKNLALCHLKISNTRKDYLHKVTTTLIREN
jgi:putative transposase